MRQSNRSHSQSPKVLFSAAAAALACGALYVVLGRTSSRPGPERASEDPSPKTAALSGELAELRATVRRLESQGHTKVAVAAAPAGPGTVVEAEAAVKEGIKDAPVDAEQQELQELARFEAQVDLLERTWDAEQPDPDWSVKAAESLTAKYEAEEFSGLRTNADCRWSMCKVDLKFAEGQDIMQLGRKAGTGFPWPGQAFFHFDAERRSGVFYLARENYELPEMGTN